MSDIRKIYDEWCQKTRRNGKILIGSMQEFFDYYEPLSTDEFGETYKHSWKFINQIRKETGCGRELAKRAYYEIDFEENMERAIDYIRKHSPKV